MTYMLVSIITVADDLNGALGEIAFQGRAALPAEIQRLQSQLVSD